jgi:hypothetical protein
VKKPVKMLLIGDSKAGKTGALASLLLAGYNVRIIDLDNGTDIIEGALKKSPEALRRLDVQTCTDGDIKVTKKVMIGGKEHLGVSYVPDGTAWDKAMTLFDYWPNIGPPTEWGQGDVLVIDSLSFLAKAALNWCLKLNGRLGTKAWDTDIGDAQTLITQSVLAKVFSANMKCHVIVVTHVDYRGGSLFKDKAGTEKRPSPTPSHDDLGLEKGFPMTIGRALNAQVGRYFNTLFLVKSVGSGGSTRRVICTRNTSAGTAQVDLASVDLDVPPELPLETGLAEYFRIVKGPLGEGEVK